MISGAKRFVDSVVALARRGSARGSASDSKRGGTSGRRYLGLLALGVLIVLLCPTSAQAMQLNPVQKQEMKQHYEKATRAYDVQKYSEAVEEYQKAYEIGGDPAMLYNVAQSYRLADQLPDALRFYRRYLQRSPNARNREDVERKISDLEKTIEERRRAAAAVPAAPVAPAPQVVVAPPPAPPSARSDEGTSGTLVAGIIVASVGAAALITAAITGKLASDNADKVSNASVFDPSAAQAEKDGKRLNTITIGAAIGGGAAIITGAVLIILSQTGGSETPRQATVSPLIGGGMLGGMALVRF